eukprot:jgi/Mesen1/2902/ME000175S02061
MASGFTFRIRSFHLVLHHHWRVLHHHRSALHHDGRVGHYHRRRIAVLHIWNWDNDVALGLGRRIVLLSDSYCTSHSDAGCVKQPASISLERS